MGVLLLRSETQQQPEPPLTVNRDRRSLNRSEDFIDHGILFLGVAVEAAVGLLLDLATPKDSGLRF